MADPPSIVAVVAHPDDEALIAGGTLALAAEAGAVCGAVALTRGELGPISDGADATAETLGEIRESELRAAGVELGLAWTACLRGPDGELEWAPREALAAGLAAVLEPRAPAALLCFGPDGVYGHPDHAASGAIAAAALDRLEAAGAQPAALYESVWPAGLMSGLAAEAARRGAPTGLWGIEPEAFGSWEEDGFALDVSAVLDRKLAALRAHRTQIGPEHLLSGLPDDLAREHLSREGWRQVRGESDTLRDLVWRG